jgi:hypothetical protein
MADAEDPPAPMRFTISPDDLVFETQSAPIHSYIEYDRNQGAPSAPPFDVIKALLDGTDVTETDPRTLAHAVAVLEDERNQAMMGFSCLRAQELDDAIDHGRALQLEALKRQRQTTMLTQAQKKRAAAETHYQSFRDGLRRREQQLDCRLAEYIEATRARHARELEAFARHWQSDAVLRRYNRTSQALRDLWKQEQMFIKVKRFVDADEVGRLAVEREKTETEDSYRQMLSDFQVSKRRMEERHSVELWMAGEVARRKREEFDSFADRVTVPWSARLKKLEVEEENNKDPQRFWNRKGRFDPHPIEQFLGMRPGIRSLRIRRADGGSVLRLPPLPVSGAAQTYDPLQLVRMS